MFKLNFHCIRDKYVKDGHVEVNKISDTSYIIPREIKLLFDRVLLNSIKREVCHGVFGYRILEGDKPVCPHFRKEFVPEVVSGEIHPTRRSPLRIVSTTATEPVWQVFSIARRVGEAIGEVPILFEPVNELGVVMIFGMIHKQLGFPYIVKVGAGFPDAMVIDQDGELRRIEFEYRLSNFLQHRHDPSKCDFIICWEDDLGDRAPDEIREKVIAIKDRLRELL